MRHRPALDALRRIETPGVSVSGAGRDPGSRHSALAPADGRVQSDARTLGRMIEAAQIDRLQRAPGYRRDTVVGLRNNLHGSSHFQLLLLALLLALVLLLVLGDASALGWLR